MLNKIIKHHNLFGHEINESLEFYMDDPLDRTVYCRLLHAVIEPQKKYCLNCPCLSGLEQGSGIQCDWIDVLSNEHVVHHEDRYKEYERVDVLIKKGVLSKKPYDPSKWEYKNSDDNKYRYVLGEKGESPLICFGINPSTASPEDLDLTMKIVKKRTQDDSRYDGYIMLNISPQRTTNPDALEYEENKFANEVNLHEIETILSFGYREIWAAWGNNITKRQYLSENLKQIIDISKKYNCKWFKADTNSEHPHHPTRLSSDTRLVEFNVEEYFDEKWGS